MLLILLLVAVLPISTGDISDVTAEFSICYNAITNSNWKLTVHRPYPFSPLSIYSFTCTYCYGIQPCLLQAGNTTCIQSTIPCEVIVTNSTYLNVFEYGYPEDELQFAQVENNTYIYYNTCPQYFGFFPFECLSSYNFTTSHSLSLCPWIGNCNFYDNFFDDTCHASSSLPWTTPTRRTPPVATTPTRPSTNKTTQALTTTEMQTSTPEASSTILTSTQRTTITTFRPNTTQATSTTIELSSSSIATTRTTKPPTTTTQTTTPIVTTPATMSLQNLSDAGVGLNNVTEVLDATLNFSQAGPTLGSTDLANIANILNNSANLNGINITDAQAILLNMDYMLNANQSEIQDSGCQDTLLNMLPSMVVNTISDVIQYTTGDNFGFVSNNFATDDSAVNGLKDDGVVYSPIDTNTFPTEKQNEIFVPSTELGGSHVLFTIYRNKKLFAGSQQYRQYGSAAMATQNAEQEDVVIPPPPLCQQQVLPSEKSPVMSASVISPSGARISRLDQVPVMAKLKFNVTTLLRPLHGNYKVTWWDEVKQIWSTEDLCSSQLNDGIVEANCPHLTDFTLIIDAMVNDPCVCDKALQDVGIVMNSLSIAALFILLAIQLTAYIPLLAMIKFLKTLRGDGMTSSRDAVQIIYNAVLFLFYLIFSIFSNQSISGGSCELIAAFSYSLLLCSLLLTIFQSQRTVMIFFPVLLQKFIKLILQPLTAFTVCFLIPFTLSLLLRFFTPFFDRQDAFCWVRPDYVVYATIIPVSILILNAIICTILVCWRLFFSKRKFSKAGRQYDSQLYQKIGAVLIMQITMGMPWVLQYFTLYLPKATVWHYIFTIVMGSQGLMLAILFFYRSNRLRLSAKSRRKNGFNSSSAAFVNSGGGAGTATGVTSLDTGDSSI